VETGSTRGENPLETVFSVEVAPMSRPPRRSVLQAGLALAAGPWFAARRAPAFIRTAEGRPLITHGVQSGDVWGGQGVVWVRGDREMRPVIEYATTESLADAKTIRGPDALAPTDYISKTRLVGLAPGQRVFYRVTLEDLAETKVRSEPVTGSFVVPAVAPKDVKFVWGGDVCGQGYGINAEFGGLKSFATMLQHEPDFFVHSGDCIYADNPIQAEQRLPDGTVWKNLVTEAKSKVAETLDDFRGNYQYNLLDEHYRAFMARTPMLVQWDDHETINNWYPGETLPAAGGRTVTSADLLAARAKRAFLEYSPIRESFAAEGRIHRQAPQGSLVEVFLIDERSFRGPNTATTAEKRSAETDFLGRNQLGWLKRALKASKATWKVIASDMPIGLIVGDGPEQFEAVANGSGPPTGREHEMADLLSWMKREKIRNTVWITADVHYAAAHHFSPERARFTDFDPFWEFVGGPLHAGTFGPGRLDDTFGPEAKFVSLPRERSRDNSPRAGLQFYGLVQARAADRVLGVSIHDLSGKELWRIDLEPQAA
jgi:alkaline phosphatase D